MEFGLSRLTIQGAKTAPETRRATADSTEGTARLQNDVSGSVLAPLP